MVRRSRIRTGAVACVACVACVAASAWVWGQVPADQQGQAVVQQVVMVAPPPPATRVETMLAAKGTIVLKGYTEVADVDGESGSGLHVVAIEVTDVSSGEKAYGLALGVRQAGPNGTSSEIVTYVDADEIDLLAKGMDYLGRMQPAGNPQGPMQAYEAHYKTKAELEVSNFDSNGARMTAVRGTQVSPVTGIMSVATAYFTPQRLADVGKQILAGKEVVEKARANK